jgi:hypothetical protein
MKYPSAPLTPFLVPLAENPHCLQIDRSQTSTTRPKLNSSLSYSSKLLGVAKELNPFAISQIRTLSPKYRGGVGSSSAKPPRSLRLCVVFCSRWFRLLFSTTYELPPPSHRFASPAFSSTYKSLFSQLACFQKHLRCPLVFPNPTKICSPQRLGGSGDARGGAIGGTLSSGVEARERGEPNVGPEGPTP